MALNYILVERSVTGVALTPLLDENGRVVKSSPKELEELTKSKK